jgi:hypothetical protein
MNKETRIFIWGLILVAIGVGCFYLDLKDAPNHSLVYNIIGYIIDFWIMWSGAKRIEKTT